MTNEEAIDIIKKYDINGCGYCHQGGNEIEEAFNMAIKALEQEDILDKIRAEIVSLTYYWCEVNPKSVKEDVLEIIDKYRK
jgi:hypothetical protein